MLHKSWLIASFLFLNLSLIGQVDRASLSGTVTDSSGAAVSGVAVQIASQATGLEREVRTDAAGVYSFAAVPIGTYTVTVSREGFKTARVTPVELGVGQNRTLDVTLEIGSIATAIDVQAQATPLNQANAEIGAVIEASQIQNIPLNGRHWASLMALAPGAINTGEGNQQSIRFFGRARDDNNWTFDGVDATGVKDPRQEAALRLVISTDSIAEFRVSSMMYSAESGVGAGAQINLVSKSGTNQFHGSVFEYIRNSALDARRFFDLTQPPPFRLNQFGGSLGGPVVRNKTFFYSNYEGLRQRLGITFAGGQVPSRAFRDQVSATAPALRPVIEAYPAGSSATASPNVDFFRSEGRQQWNEDSGMARVDHHFTDRTTMFGRYNIDDGNINEPRDALLNSRVFAFRPSNVAFQVQHVFSPAVINESRVGVNRSALNRFLNGPLLESVSIQGFTTLPNSTYEKEVGTSYAIIDNFSVVRGRHTIKSGIEVRRIHLNVGNSAAASLSFASAADLLINRVDNISINGELPTIGTRRTLIMPYLQDEFRVRRNLTLSLGVRYEYYTVMKEVRDRARVFDLTECGGYCAAGSPFYYPDRNNLDPRVALAWTPDAFGGKTVFRGGFGMFHGAGQMDDVNAAIDSYAERFSLTVREVPTLSFPIAGFVSSAQNLGSTPRALQRDRRDLYTQQWNFTIQQNLGSSFVGQAAYVGNRGSKLFSRTYVNVIDPALGRRPLTQFGRIDMKANVGNSTFHGLQSSLQRSFVRGLLVQAQYMWSHSINDNSVGGGEAAEPMNVACRACERGDSGQDIRHTFTANSVLQLPFGPGRRFVNTGGFESRLLEGWDMSGIFTTRTGRPVNVSVTRSSNDVPDGNNSNQRPNVVSGVPLYPENKTIGNWINRAAFAIPARGTWGNAGRNLLRGPGMWQLDFALAKKTRLTEQVSLDFRAEAFNIMNHTNFGNPAANISNADFGLITSVLNTSATGTGTARQIQFMMRLNF